jgi:hypothetical protein
METKKGDQIAIKRTRHTGVVLAVEKDGAVIMKDTKGVTHRITLNDVTTIKSA